jgi:hypothetical protein
LSYVHAVRALKRRLPAAVAIPPEERQSWLDSVLAEIASEPSVKTRNRSNPRGVKRKMSGFNTRKRGEPLNLGCEPVIRVFAK